MSASKIPPNENPSRTAPAEAVPTVDVVTATPAPTAAPPDVASKPRLPPTIRAGMGDVTTELVEIYGDEDERRATGLLSILGPDGHADPERVPMVDAEVWRGIYRGMLRIRLLDQQLVALAGTGRIGVYADSRGQEAAVVAPLAALADSDWVVPSHREGGAALYRGMPMRAYLAHALGNANDLSKGRRAPAHPGALRALRILPAAGASAAQLPQATGLAWAAKIKKDSCVVLAYLGEGATSAEDFHTGINFAAVFRVPAVFVCVNNGWSVSTPASAQSGSATFAIKALAYGMPGIRVDGNDPLALFDAVRAAVERARRGDGPTLIEAVTYRLGGFSSADHGGNGEPSYRDAAEVAGWSARDPLLRFSTWLNETAILEAHQQARLASEIEAEIRGALDAEGPVGPPALGTLIEDVYLHPPAELQRQLAELKRIRGKT
jgi:pyruvate dehydrogenase E1 component alpha subunit